MARFLSLKKEIVPPAIGKKFITAYFRIGGVAAPHYFFKKRVNKHMEGIKTTEPRNKRTIGTPEDACRVYLEDYVYTYLKGEHGSRGAILTGRREVDQDGIRIFITGAMECSAIDLAQDELFISKRVWNYIYQELRASFANQEVVGWYVPVMEETKHGAMDKIARLHERDFVEEEMVFFYQNREDIEQDFYTYHDGRMQKLPGYYLFYDRNPQMRDYIMMKAEERQLEKDLRAEQLEQDRVVMRYRDYMNSQNNLSRRKKYMQKEKVNAGLAYTMCVLAIVGMFALSIGIAAGYQQVHQMEEAMTEIEQQIGIPVDSPMIVQ